MLLHHCGCYKALELRDFIYVENHIPRELCEETLDYIEVMNWRPHQWSSYNREDGVNNDNGTRDDDPSVLSLPNENHNTKLRNHVHDAINNHYGSRLNLHALRFNRYPVGARLKKHDDHITTLFDGKRKGIPILSIIGQLNDDYEGGELVINDEIIPLKQGDICIFPSVYLYPHEIRTVTKGERISFVAWAY